MLTLIYYDHCMKHVWNSTSVYSDAFDKAISIKVLESEETEFLLEHRTQPHKSRDCSGKLKAGKGVLVLLYVQARAIEFVPLLTACLSHLLSPARRTPSARPRRRLTDVSIVSSEVFGSVTLMSPGPSLLCSCAHLRMYPTCDVDSSNRLSKVIVENLFPSSSTDSPVVRLMHSISKLGPSRVILYYPIQELMPCY